MVSVGMSQKRVANWGAWEMILDVTDDFLAGFYGSTVDNHKAVIAGPALIFDHDRVAGLGFFANWPELYFKLH